jgi:hypothetical protein
MRAVSVLFAIIAIAAATDCVTAMNDTNCNLACKSAACTGVKSAGSDWSDFFGGLVTGVLAFPNSPNLSPCLRSYDAASQSLPDMLNNFALIFTSLDPTRIFNVIDGFRAFTANLTSMVDACELPRLTQELKTVITKDTGSAILVRLVTSSGTILGLYSSITGALGAGEFDLAGEYLGNILSILLAYKI